MDPDNGSSDKANDPNSPRLDKRLSDLIADLSFKT